MNKQQQQQKRQRDHVSMNVPRGVYELTVLLSDAYGITMGKVLWLGLERLFVEKQLTLRPRYDVQKYLAELASRGAA